MLMLFPGMTSLNTAEYKFYLKSSVIQCQFIIIILSATVGNQQTTRSFTVCFKKWSASSLSSALRTPPSVYVGHLMILTITSTLLLKVIFESMHLD